MRKFNNNYRFMEDKNEYLEKETISKNLDKIIIKQSEVLKNNLSTIDIIHSNKEGICIK